MVFNHQIKFDMKIFLGSRGKKILRETQLQVKWIILNGFRPVLTKNSRE